MISMRSLATTRTVLEPAIISRYNDTEAAPIFGVPGPNASSGQALDAMIKVSQSPAAGLFL